MVKSSDIKRQTVREAVKEQVRRWIESSGLRAGDRIMSQNELAKKMSVDPMTVHKALTELADEGLIVRIKGKGTFVAETGQKVLLKPIAFINELTIDFQAHPYYGNLVTELTRLCSNAGYELVSYYSKCPTITLENNPNAVLQQAWNNREFSGVIINIETLKNLREELNQSNVPYVGITGDFENVNQVHMKRDYFKILSYLHSRNAKNIGIIGHGASPVSMIDRSLSDRERRDFLAWNMNLVLVDRHTDFDTLDGVIACDDMAAMRYISDMVKFKDHSNVVVFENEAMPFPNSFCRAILRPARVAESVWNILRQQIDSDQQLVEGCQISHDYTF
jgi:DNA-binding transcriptional regulator YhcF (GntR family)